jgi:hypothetical protein
MIVVVVPVVHEEVHQRTGGEEQPRWRPEYMRRVLGDEKKSGNDEKACADDPRFTAPEAHWFVLIHDGPRMIVGALSKPVRKVVVKGTEDKGYVPAPRKAFHES